MYQCCPHIETSQLICTANQLTGFYMRATLALNGLKAFFKINIVTSSLFSGIRSPVTCKFGKNLKVKYDVMNLLLWCRSWIFSVLP